MHLARGLGCCGQKGYPLVRFGVWNEEGYGTRSNYREFLNLVEAPEEVGMRGNFQGNKVFLCTYNMVLESIAAASSSKSEVIFNLVV